MKGVVLAGGLGTRLSPLTEATNKHLLPVYNMPMIYYPIQTLVNAGIRDILAVTGGPHAGHFLHVLKNGDEFGIRHLEYAFQKGEGGISHALSLAEKFVDGDSVCVILGDNCTDADIKQDIESFKNGAKIFLKEVNDPQRFGVPTFGEDGKIIRIDEKPSSPNSNYAVTGLYVFDETVFRRIKTLKPSARGELEVTDLINTYIEEEILTWSELNGFWKDAGTFDTLAEVNNYWYQKNIRGK